MKNQVREYMPCQKIMKRKTTGLKIVTQYEDINTLDVDTITVDGYNRKEISEKVEELLTNGFKMYGKIHKWKVEDKAIADTLK